MLKNKKNNKGKSSKSRNKRILTIYSSQNSILEPVPKGTSVPLKKINKSSVSNLNVKAKQPAKKQKPRHHTVSMKNKPAQNYEKIAMHFVNSNTNSEIQFSNYGETRKDISKPFKKGLKIDCDQQALIKQIWRQDKRKNTIQQKAAIKIQKVFRGYLTRKLLMKYVQAYEQKLLMERQMLERQMRMKYESSLDLIQNSSKLTYLPSNKIATSQYEWQKEEKENPLDLESSIMVASVDNGHSIHEQSNTYDRRQIEAAQRQSFTLNESIIARQQETSMSFGQENQHSPHFLPVVKRKNSRQAARSPFEEEHKCNHYVSEDKTGDGFSQNISSCPSYSKPYKHHQKQQESRMSSLMREEEAQHMTQRDSIHLEHLRSTEKAKWQQVIELVNDQMKEGINQQKTRDLMSFILEFSVKNREELNNKSSFQVTPTTITNRHEEPENISNNDRNISFKKKKWNEISQTEKIKKNQNLPLSRKQKEDKTILERTSNMKQYLLKNIVVQDQQIDKLMDLREAVLRRKQSNSLIELNNLLENNELSQDDFLQRMSTLTSKFLKQKKDIQQTKDEIYQGYRAQIQLFKNTIIDAKYLGYHIPFCRSMEIYPNYPKWRFDEVMIDQLNLLAHRRGKNEIRRQIIEKIYHQPPELSTRKIDEMLEDHSKFKEEQERQVFNQSESEDQANFSYEETDIYNKSTPYCSDIRQIESNEFVLSPKNLKKINDFNRYGTIALNDEIDKKEKRLNTSEQKEFKRDEQQQQQYISLKRMPKKQTFKIEYSSDEEEQEVAIYQQSNDRQIQDSVNYCFNKLLYDFLEDMFKNPKFIQSFKFSKNHKKKLMQPITKHQKLQFLQSTVLILPKFSQIQSRLNQKMYPNTKELLISMRQEIQGADSQHQYYEIGHYEYILNQQICYESIQIFIQSYQTKNKEKAIKKQNLHDQSILSEMQKYSSSKMKKYVQNYNLTTKIKQEQAQQLRQQVLKIELHLVLDAWNELLIKYRENKLGYSGIGLNQITFSLIDRVCRQIKKQSQWQQMISETKSQLQEMIKNDALHEKLIKQYEQFVSQNDSQWILYAQQGLQYGFDLTKALEVELIFELLEQLHHLNEQRGCMERKQADNDNEEQKEESIQQGYHQNEDLEEDEEQESKENSESFSEHLQLNEDEQQQLEKKMENMNNYPDSDESFDD